MAVVFDPVFSWLKKDKAPDNPSQLSHEFFKVNTVYFAQNIQLLIVCFQNFIEMYNKNVKGSRKQDPSMWLLLNGGIPHVPERYRSKKDTERCTLIFFWYILTLH
jgi:hypothetical protein